MGGYSSSGWRAQLVGELICEISWFHEWSILSYMKPGFQIQDFCLLSLVKSLQTYLKDGDSTVLKGCNPLTIKRVTARWNSSLFSFLSLLWLAAIVKGSQGGGGTSYTAASLDRWTLVRNEIGDSQRQMQSQLTVVFYLHYTKITRHVGDFEKKKIFAQLTI